MLQCESGMSDRREEKEVKLGNLRQEMKEASARGIFEEVLESVEGVKIHFVPLRKQLKKQRVGELVSVE